MLLVVGATGQLGTAIVGKLLRDGHSVRALVRKTSNFDHLLAKGAEIVKGDLRDSSSLHRACSGIDTLISTANTALPREKGDSFAAVDDVGYASLINAAREQGVDRFIYTSALSHPEFDKLPLISRKRVTEDRLRSSGLEYTIFRATAFMDVSFAMMGSELPLRGAEAATVSRPFWFTTRFYNSVKNKIAGEGKIGILGDGSAKQSYICIDDVAEFHVKAVNNPAAANATFDLGGPEAVSQLQVKEIYEKVMGVKLKAQHTPATVFKIGYRLLKPFSPAAANIMGLNHHAATTDAVVDMTTTAGIFDVELTSVEEFFTKRINSPA
jgi:uncharacterized protein YbjT (DUF2867 family)